LFLLYGSEVLLFFILFGTSFALRSLEKCSSTELDSEYEDFGIMRRGLLAILLLFLSSLTVGSASAFDVEEYQLFLERNEDLSAGELEEMFPTGSFEKFAPTDFAHAAFFDSVDFYYRLTGEEKELLGRHGFAVTERLGARSFGDGFLDVYHKDLPVFVSTDAILHALHMSYDAILIDLETGLLRPRLEKALALMHGELGKLTQLADPVPGTLPVWVDADVYLTVARRLLGEDVKPVFAENLEEVQGLVGKVRVESPATVDLFGQAGRNVDFSQFTPRGHYTQSEELTEYFQAMIWLGRTELYLTPPTGVFPPVPEEVVRHQAALAAMLIELAEASEAEGLLEEIDRMLVALVGEQDNASLGQMQEVMAAADVGGPADLLDVEGWERFREALVEKEYGQQKILSQILMGDPFAPEEIEPASAFLLLGQRFVVDSYVTGNVVFDKIRYGGAKVFRGLPSTLDVLFALGNDAALPLLREELEEYRYAANLAGLRYLVGSFERDFWEGTFYNGWLDAIRSLNPPTEREELPAFMRTGAWWQEKLNTQLASWAQLRHDNLLYAKQSYTGGVVCSFPEGYVEPIPEFYRRVGRLAENAGRDFEEMLDVGDYRRERIGGYFEEMAAIADTLEGIAQKELDGEELSEEERLFLQTVVYDVPMGCTTGYRGWYARLFYTGEEGLLGEDLVVADVHTQPMDAFGNPVGHVLHAGTGPLNMAVVVAETCAGKSTAFVGPVMSYYEHVSLNFKRLTDEEWRLVHGEAPSFRPDFVRIYLADAEGKWRGGGASLPTAVREVATSPKPEMPGLVLHKGYPNPFNSSTLIRFSVGPELAGARVQLDVFNMEGKRVRQLVDQVLPEGNYGTRWEGMTDAGESVASGVYVYRLTAGGRRLTGRVSLVK